MLRASLIVFVLLLISVAELSSQQLLPLERYQRVRLTTATYHGVVAVERMTVDTLIGRSFNGGAEVRVPLATIERLEVSRGFPSPDGGALLGGGIGLLVGVGVGAALGYAAGDNRPCKTLGEAFDFFNGCGITAREKATIFGLLGALPGALVGGVIGAVTTPEERWERVPLAVQVGAAPRRDGSVVVVVSRRF